MYSAYESLSIDFLLNQKNGGIKYLRIKTREKDDTYKTVWEMDAQLSDTTWEIGQVNISGQNIVVEAEKNTEHAGYAAVDEFLIIPGLDSCTTLPTNANVDNPTSAPPTQPPSGKNHFDLQIL